MTEQPESTGGQACPGQRCHHGWKAYVLLVAISLIVAALGGRLAWVAAGTETGWRLLCSQWWDATVGLLAGRNTPISEQEPSDQAAFWLEETERITSDEPQNAEIAMGAALVLDSPAQDFMCRYFKMSDLSKSLDATSSIHVGIGPQVDQLRLDNELAQFEDRCGPRCLAMAKRATELAPGELCWWRLRALLQISDTPFGKEQQRTADWLREMEQCSTHDQDNAFYDYLIASRLWEDSIGYSFSGDEMKLEVKDQQQFEDAQHHFERGQQKSQWKTDDVGRCRALLALLGRSDVPAAEQLTIAQSRLIPVRTSLAMMRLLRTQLRRAEQQEKAGDLSGALTLLRQNVRCLDQIAESEQSLAFDGSMPFLHNATLTAIETLAKTHPELVSSKELASIKKDVKAAVLRKKVLAEAGSRLKKKQAGEPVSMVAGMLVGVAASTAAILLVTGAICWLVSRCLRMGRQRPPQRLGPYRHAAAWLVGYTLTFAALGLAPARIIPAGVQPWIAIAFGGAIAIGVVIWLIWKAASIFHWNWGVRIGLAVALGLIAALGLLSILDAVPYASLAVPARAWQGGNVDVLQHILKTQTDALGGRWGWALLQWWLAYPGVHASIVVSMALLAVLYSRRRARSDMQAQPGLRSCSQWAGLLACLGHSMLIVGCGWLLVYLCLAPSIVRSVENAYQSKMAWLGNPQQYWQSVKATVGQIEADKDWMNQASKE